MFKRASSVFKKRISNLLVSLLLIASNAGFALAPFISAQKAAAATPDICTVDVQGANDEPGQKDLSKFCEADDDTSGELTISWNWDEIAWSGANTGDACALFDTNSNDLTDYAVCVTVSGNPAVQSGVSPRIYSCNDTALEKCMGDDLIPGAYQTTCSVSQSATDPFPGPPTKKKGAAYPNDTSALCVIQLSEVGAGSAELLDVCSFPSQQPNSDPSDCIITSTGQANPVIEVKKDLVPNDDNGRFNLRIDLATDVTVSNVGDGGTTGEVEFTGNSVVIEETGYTGTSLANYTTQVSCVDDENPATPFFSEPRTGVTSRTATINLPQGVVDITCTFVNTRKNANIHVIKDVINDNGGTKTYADFTFQVNGGSAQTFDPTTSPDGSKTISVPLGSTYTITEPQANQDGYSTSYSNCTDILPVDGQTVTCTITNDDIAPTITLEKTVVNDDGGSAVETDFQAKIDGSNVSWDSANSVSAGNHTASETTLQGYDAGDWGGHCNVDGTITVQLGQNYTCTITNDDIAPTLQLIKNLTNDNGGTASAEDWYLIATIQNSTTTLINEQGTSNDGGATAETNTVNATAGITYILSESGGPSEYTVGNWSCQGATIVGVSITLSLAQTAICTITNDDDAPSLTLVKEVTNDNGGTAAASEWTLTASGPTGFSGSGPSVSNGTSFDAGTYDLSESGGPTGYTASDWDCVGGTQNDSDTVTVGLGESATCTITNDDDAPVLHLRKVVINEYGGTATVDDFTLTADGTGSNDISGTSPVDSDATLAADTFELSESGPSGYTASDWDCVGGTQNGASITLELGQEATCTITNTRDTGTIEVRKEIEPESDNGLFDLQINGVTEKDDASDGDTTGAVQVVTGSYDVSEVAGDSTDLSDYSTTLTCTKNGQSLFTDVSTTDSDDFEVDKNDVVVCTFTNVRYGRIIVEKQTQPDGSAQSFSFDASYDQDGFSLADGQQNDSGNLLPGEYSVTEEVPVGWDLSDAYCSDESDPSDIYLSAGETITCYFNNTQRGSVKVTKFNDYDRDGKKDENEPTLPDWTFTLEGEEECSPVLYDSFSQLPCFEDTEYSSLHYFSVCDILPFLCNGNDYDYFKQQATGDNGTTTFTEVKPGVEHELSEELKEGWYWSNTYCEYGNREGYGSVVDDNRYELTVQPGEELECFVGNYRDAVLVLEKTNNKPEPTVNGDVVTYTLTVKVPEDSNPVYGVEVKDLIPENFEYVPGSASASQGSLTETYASPGTWTLGDIFPGGIVTLTYRALITNSVSPGTYPDLAFALGGDNPVEGQAVYSNVHLTTNNPFVGTNVTIKGEVLGAVLVNTGNRWMALQFVVPIFVILGVLSLESRQKKGASL